MNEKVAFCLNSNSARKITSVRKKRGEKCKNERKVGETRFVADGWSLHSQHTTAGPFSTLRATSFSESHFRWSTQVQRRWPTCGLKQIGCQKNWLPEKYLTIYELLKQRELVPGCAKSGSGNAST